MQTISAPRRTASAGKTRFYAGGVVIVLAIGWLIFNGIQSGGNYYLTLDELAAKESTLGDRGVRVNAIVDKDSVHYDSRAISLSFDLLDPESGARRTVVYNEPMPDLFMKSESVIVEGMVGANGTLEAHTILVKCPSKYEEAQENGEAVPTDHFKEQY
ncbi:MAG TPA: cytochrome c maturation protein CcmE [Ardenticatenaceae bacterium]|jgi:cytochrome c-type biogenesis protein CcmE